MVKCIHILEQFGDVREIESPLQKDIFVLLKGPGTFVGQYPEIDVVVMKCRESIFELELNQNKLPKPFENEQILGSILLIKMNENSEPEDFTMKEYEERCT